MDLHNQRGYIRHTFIRLRPKHYRTKLLVSLVILAIVSFGIVFNWFARTGVLNFSPYDKQLQVQLSSLNLESYGIPGKEIENDINQFLASMSSAQQGTHFLLGIISGFVFSQPLAGLSVGIIKEIADFFVDAKLHGIGGGYFIDTGVDMLFWFLGGVVGFYLLTGLYDLFREHNIDGVKDLVKYGGRSLRKWIRGRRASQHNVPETKAENEKISP